MRREWSFHRPQGKKKTVWLILLAVALFVLGFFAARPIFSLFGLIS